MQTITKFSYKGKYDDLLFKGDFFTLDTKGTRPLDIVKSRVHPAYIKQNMALIKCDANADAWDVFFVLDVSDDEITCIARQNV